MSRKPSRRDGAARLISNLLLFTVGLAALTLGADWLVRGACRAAESVGMSPLVIGLTVVAFGTSAPELVVSVAAALRGQPGLAIGNIMGSTVANVGLIVGLGAVIRPIDVHRRLLVRESPLLVFVLAIVMVLSYNGALGRLDGLALVTGFSIYLLFLMRWALEERSSSPRLRGVGRSPGGDDEKPGVGAPAGEGRDGEAREPSGPRRKGLLEWLRVGAGLALLLLGADWLVDSATAIARAFDVPEEVIGATMVAVGTSLPERASTVAAAVRGLGDVAVGNVIGSNVFNLGLVLGTAALVAPLQLPPRAVVREVVPALIFCIALIPLAYTGGRIQRGEGGLLLLGYAGFILWIL